MSAARYDYRGTDPKQAFKALLAVDAKLHEERRKRADDHEEGAVRASALPPQVAAMFGHMSKMETFREVMREMGQSHRAVMAQKAAGTWKAPEVEPAPVKNTETGLHVSGRLVELPDYDDSTELWEPDKETANVSESEAEGLRLREGEFAFYCRNRAGEVVDEETKEKADRARRKIDDQTANLALALSSQGIQAFLPKKAPRASIVDPFSEQRIDMQPVRRINFLPAVAKMKRAGMLKHLTAYVSARPFVRMATFTIGKRRRLDRAGEIRSGYQFLHRRLSNLNAHPLLSSHGCHLVFRSSEGGSALRACPFPREPGTENGVIFVHIHAHVFLYFDKQLSPRRFKRFMAKMWNLWRFHWDYGRTIADPNEACKYPFKGDELEAMSDAEIAALYRETRRLHMVQPLGELREVIAARHEAAIKGRNWRSAKTSELELKFRPDWNARPRMSATERRGREAMRRRLQKLGLSVYSDAAKLLTAANSMLAKAAKIQRSVEHKTRRAPLQCAKHRRPAPRACIKFELLLPAIFRAARTLQSAAETLLRFNPRPFAESRLSGIRKVREADKTARDQRPIRNRVCARLGPAPYFDRITRPALLVWNFDGDYAALRALPFVKEYAQACADRIAAAEAQISGGSARHSVHTSHLTAACARDRDSDPPGLLLASAEAWQPSFAEETR